MTFVACVILFDAGFQLTRFFMRVASSSCTCVFHILPFTCAFIDCFVFVFLNYVFCFKSGCFVKKVGMFILCHSMFTNVATVSHNVYDINRSLLTILCHVKSGNKTAMTLYHPSYHYSKTRLQIVG